MSATPPGDARSEFPRLEEPGQDDLDIVERQLGRPPSGEVFVAARCLHGRPAVILTVPFEGEGRSVPPLLWLTCPHACRYMGVLESGGSARRFAEMLKSDSEAGRDFMAEEERFGAVLDCIAKEAGVETAGRFRGRGAAGGAPGAVQGRHAHLAYRLASGRGVVGGWCLEELVKNVGRACERVPQGCVG